MSQLLSPRPPPVPKAENSSTVGSVQLTKDIILDAALSILDEYGLGDLTIRRLSRHLETAAGAMYWHFPSKQALLGAVADRILSPCTHFAPSGDWRRDTADFSALLHSCLTSHRDGAEVVSAALATNTATVRPEKTLADALLAANGAVPEAATIQDTAAVLVYFILGATVDEQTASNLQTAKKSASSDKELSSSAEDVEAEMKKEPGSQRIKLGTELFIAGIAARS